MVCIHCSMMQRTWWSLLGIVQHEFKEYYIQMQAAKRSQAPIPSQIVMTHAGKLYWILQMVCWCALFQATVLIGCCCHQMKRSKMWTNKKLVRQDEAEPFMGLGRFAYLLGYNCDDEKELEAA
ncbi:uncharacterized protein LOC132042543 isoform X2 [Lycium ferocissimum]|uniref:uncharacterized protein LOC132042543 isoform X2 n=1 Tax=Lycium ferocissimum TaxID=112874 RepID=UPI002814F999|nr:uncharacterized protein LOC132042543 isoform X2 [Lycium ferocissimum]